jgi:hypothetical protein
MGPAIILRCGRISRAMSGSGPNSAVAALLGDGSYTLRPDMDRIGWHGRKVPKADMHIIASYLGILRPRGRAR